MQGESNEELEIIDIEYSSVLDEVSESNSTGYEDDDEIVIETDEVTLSNLLSEHGSVEIDNSQDLTRGDSDFFSLNEDDLADDSELGELSEQDLYINPSFGEDKSSIKELDKEKVLSMAYTTINSTIETMNQIIKSLYYLPDINRVNYEDMTEVKNYVNSVDNKAPFFVTNSVQNETFGYMQRDMAPEDIFYASSLSQVDKNNEAKKIMFIDWVNKLYSKQDSFKKSNEHSLNINKKSKEILLSKMFSDISITEKFSALMSTKDRNIYTDFYTDGVKITHFKCNNCSTENSPHLVKLPDDLMVITNINGQPGFIITPSVCDKCGAFYVLAPTPFKNISSKCRAIGSRLTAGAKSANGLKVATYKPSAIEISNLLSLYHNVLPIPGLDESYVDDEVAVSSKSNEVEYDWNAICKDFRDLNVMIGDSLFKLSKPEGSLHNVTKVVANQLNIYPRLKENALASLILTLEKEGLYNFSLTSKTYYKVYSKISNLSNVTATAMKNLSEIFTYNLVNEDGTIDYTLAAEVFDKIRKNNDNFENDKKEFLANLDRYKYMLSYIPISSIDLREDMIYNYLSDDEIKSILDEISDLMILNHLAEELFSSLSIPDSKDVKSKMTANRKFHNIKQNILSVNRKKPLKDYIEKLSNSYFAVNSKTIVGLISNGDSMSNLSEFLEACYKGDVYDMHKYYGKINLWDAGNCEDCIKELFEFISYFPAEKINTDKFSYYFDFDCEVSYKARFVKMFESKGFVPRVMKGDTIDEKLEYYSKCSNYDAKEIIPGNISRLLSNYKYVIAFGRYLSYSGMYRDFGAYYGMRDILYQVQNRGVDKLLNALSLDSVVASLLIEEDYNYPSIDLGIVKDYIYLVLPIFDPDLEEVQTDITKSYRERINTIIGDVEGLISSYKDLDGLNELVSDLIKDLSNRKEV